jgi:hypothetical protein
MQNHTIEIDDGKPAGVVDRSFAAFLRTAAGQAACGSDLISRLSPSAGTITTLPGLLRWARERHPDQYPAQDWRAPLPTSAAPFGSQAMKRIWAAFLKWREAL